MAEIGLMLIGGFYVYAGFVATRGALATALFDRAMAQNAGRETPPLDTLRTLWLLAGSASIAVSGATLVLLLDASRYVFVAAAVIQGTYLHVASPYLFEKASAETGRDQVLARMAYMIFLAATLLVLIAGHFGLLRGLAAVSTTSLVLVAVVAAAITGIGLWRTSGPTPGDEL